MPIKVTVIGAGSVGFTRGISRDILTVPELQDTEFVYHDLSEHNLSMVSQLVQRDIEASKLPATVKTTLNRREALEGADYVLSFVRVGGLEAFAHDVDIPLKYGVDQCVGDTLGPGGLMYAQRGVPVLLDFCKDIREVAASDALFLNYSNPMAMLTWACNKYGGVNTVGLCHGVQGGHHQIASAIENWARKRGTIGPEEKVHRRDVDIICAGINHQTWYIKIQWRGLDIVPLLLEMFEEHPEFPTTEKVRIDMLKRFGYYSTESNGHLSEYVPWYRKRPSEITEWIDLGSWINGETGGYLRVCTEGRRWFEHDFPNWMTAAPNTFKPEDRGEEHGSYIIEALETGRVYRGHFNVVNNGTITNLPDDAIIEAPGYVDKNGISIPRVGELPLGPAAVCNSSISVQRLGVEAAVHGDLTLLKQAMILDPLTGAVCNPPEVWQMADEMLVALEPWLPNYSKSMHDAKVRLELSSRMPARDYQGAARIPTKSLEELEVERDAQRKLAMESDKAHSRPANRATPVD